MTFQTEDFIPMDKYNQRLQVDERILSAAVHFSQDSVVITTKDLDLPGPHIIYVNPKFTKMTGYEPEDVLGKTPRILQGPKTDRSVLQRLRSTLEAGGVFFGQAVNYRKDGTEFWNEWHIEPIRDGQGNVTHYLSIQHDVTDRKKAEEIIAQKNSALKEIIEQIEIEKRTIKEDVRLNVEKVLLPALSRLYRKGTRLDKKYIGILENSLKDLASSFGSSVSADKSALSPREVEIANLIKNGVSSKEISGLLNISFKTVETHRNKIRRKFGLLNKEVNLTTYLRSL